ncbi:MAG: carboxypeptidase-like regulatory domain-containing protein [Bacteroidota bacterium]
MLLGSLPAARAVALTLLLLTPVLAWAQRTSGEVIGQVAMVGGTPIPDATVVVTGTNYGATSDADGHVRLVLPEGRWSLTVSAPGFAVVTDSVTVTRDEQTRFYVVLILTDPALAERHAEAQQNDGTGVFDINPALIQEMPRDIAEGLRAISWMPMPIGPCRPRDRRARQPGSSWSPEVVTGEAVDAWSRLGGPLPAYASGL